MVCVTTLIGNGLRLLVVGLLLLSLTGCGMFSASANIGTNLKPSFGAGLNVPLGK